MAQTKTTTTNLSVYFLLIISFSLAMSGCSSSSDSTPTTPETEMETEADPVESNDDVSSDELTPIETQPDAETPVDDSNPANDTPDDSNQDESNQDDFNQNGDQTASVDTTQPDDTVAEPDPPTALEPEPAPEDPVMPSPTTVRIDFDITVPAYQSSELRVEVEWGDITLNASWVGDEYWAASGDFTAETENTLAVTFYDRNGAIELARSIQVLATDASAAMSIQISADQFDADQFDSDGDEVSNLAELMAGSDPLIDEDALLDVNEFTTIFSDWSRMSVQQSFEYLIPETRPHVESFIPDIPLPFEGFPGNSGHGSIFGDVDIDGQGNGTLRYGYYWPIDQRTYSGTRTYSDNSVLWEGSRQAYDGDFTHAVTFTNRVTVVDENTRTFVQEIAGSNIGTFDFRWETSTNLTGALVEGTSLCRPVAGTFSATYRASPPGSITTITISKALDDPYWRFIREFDNSGAISTVEYFTRELIMHIPTGYDAETVLPKDKYFQCDFVDFE